MKRKDQKYLNWLSFQPCACCQRFSEYHNGLGRNVAAHVRRANNSGVAYKPLYSAIPLCHNCHSKQHQHGESSLGLDCVAKADWYLAQWKLKSKRQD